MRKLYRVGFWSALLLTIIACGGGGGGGTGGAAAGGGNGGGGNNGVNLSTNAATIVRGQSINFTASVPGQASQTVLFELTTPGFGTLTQTGQNTATYTAPNTAGTARILAKSAVNANLTATAVVTVQAVGITVSPSSANVARSGKVNFTASVQGIADQRVTWSIPPNSGSIVPTGGSTAQYTAPAVIPSNPTSYTITARSVANTAVTAKATVTVSFSVGQNATVTGRVLSGNGGGVANVTVIFLTSGGQELARTNTQANGTFSAAVPTSAKEFNLVPSSFSNNFYKAFTYNSKRYTPLSVTCGGPLPTLTAGVTHALIGDIVIPPGTDPPPPPPNGCS